ncbi:putative metalloprotease with PDZ domain [Chryseobacterium sp. 7]|uniref:M61 family metallopeptidase n=1 Tax=Chryseobacterium sp. 7 TaxID=2035214 RepID=UPI000EAC8B52|nr:peptidase M61 [Chryseobacterium sp. 7]RLJ33223.1 putative metalloprotease with PDZ domain [Chryseobacterium sp. 7]
MDTLIKLFVVIILLPNVMMAQTSKKNYEYNIDLLHMSNDEVRVSFSPPKNTLKQGKFIIPKLVPGFYQAMNFGQYVSDFTATDKNGKKVLTERLDKNSWMVHDLNHVKKISYQVADGWDSLEKESNEARSAGSMFIKDSVFVINYNSLVGYFEEMKDIPYQITITKNKDFYASSALDYRQKNNITDMVWAKDYRELVDSPVMYSVPDTTWLKIGHTKVLVSFYNKKERNYSKKIAHEIENILKNQQAYLGGTLPVNKYAFLIYYESSNENGFLGDGLEHSHSTVCLYRSGSMKFLPNALNRVASHEFFHVVTPLNIHSGEIQHYDFLNPVMSKHLWLYEGMTEYATIHMPIKQKMISMEDFEKSLEEKIKEMKAFDNTLSFTEMSKKSMERQDQYMNFYMKGALLGVCLDIRLRELSNGKMGTQDLMQMLMKKYGAGKYFNDDELFDDITKMTFPEIRTFFRDYIEGSQPIPLKEYLEKAGFNYDEATGKVTTLPNPDAKQLALRKAWINQ